MKPPGRAGTAAVTDGLNAPGLAAGTGVETLIAMGAGREAEKVPGFGAALGTIIGSGFEIDDAMGAGAGRVIGVLTDGASAGIDLGAGAVLRAGLLLRNPPKLGLDALGAGLDERKPPNDELEPLLLKPPKEELEELEKLDRLLPELPLKPARLGLATASASNGTIARKRLRMNLNSTSGKPTS